MTNLALMKKELHISVIKPLMEQGFTGKWPHFRRESGEHIDLISFQINKYGNSFTVELSAIFPNHEDKNFAICSGIPLTEINVWHTNYRHRLKGMYGGWFYYSDVYCKRISLLNKAYWCTNKRDFPVPKCWKLVQRFEPETATLICHSVNQQLVNGFKWLNTFVKKHS